MSVVSNAPIVRRSYDAFARDDMDGVLGDMHPDIVWHQAQGLPHGGVYHGLDEVRRNIFDLLDRDWWSEFTAEPGDFLDAGNEVVVLGRYHGVAQGTEKLDVPFVHVWTMRDGKAVRFRQFLDTAGWIEAYKGSGHSNSMALALDSPSGAARRFRLIEGWIVNKHCRCRHGRCTASRTSGWDVTIFGVFGPADGPASR